MASSSRASGWSPTGWSAPPHLVLLRDQRKLSVPSRPGYEALPQSKPNRHPEVAWPSGTASAPRSRAIRSTAAPAASAGAPRSSRTPPCPRVFPVRPTFRAQSEGPWFTRPVPTHRANPTDGGHERLPGHGHLAARWRAWELPGGGQQICPGHLDRSPRGLPGGGPLPGLAERCHPYSAGSGEGTSEVCRGSHGNSCCL
jgi:hypothetical protein